MPRLSACRSVPPSQYSMTWRFGGYGGAGGAGFAAPRARPFDGPCVQYCPLLPSSLATTKVDLGERKGLRTTMEHTTPSASSPGIRRR
jgi:hypothetical protein